MRATGWRRRRAAVSGARRRLARSLLGLGIAGLTLTAPAGGEALDDPCADDAARLCVDAGPTRAGRQRCLKERVDELSEGCRALLAEPERRRAEASEACGDDAARLCSGVQPGRNNTGMLSCLRANASALSEECRNALDALPGRRSIGASESP